MPSLDERFWSKVQFTDGCWWWKAAATPSGYGKYFLCKVAGQGKFGTSHRLAYEELIGPIPDGLTLDHLCRNRACVNPSHLEAVSNRENILRGTGWAGRHAQATHCVQGHEFTPANTRYRARPEGGRICLACRTIRNREITERRRAERQPATSLQQAVAEARGTENPPTQLRWYA